MLPDRGSTLFWWLVGWLVGTEMLTQRISAIRSAIDDGPIRVLTKEATCETRFKEAKRADRCLFHTDSHHGFRYSRSSCRLWLGVLSQAGGSGGGAIGGAGGRQSGDGSRRHLQPQQRGVPARDGVPFEHHNQHQLKQCR